MTLDEFQNHPYYENDVVNPDWNENDKVTPLNSSFKAKTQQNQECDGDEPGEQGALNEAHSGAEFLNQCFLIH